MNWLTQVRKRSREARDAHDVRDQTIRRAVTEGHTLQEVAAAASLSKARVHQIAREEK